MKTRFVRKGMIFFILVLLISVGFISGSYGFQPSNSQNQGVNAQLSDELLFETSFEQEWIPDNEGEYLAPPQWDVDGLSTGIQNEDNGNPYYWTQIDRNFSHSTSFDSPIVYDGEFAAGIWGRSGPDHKVQSEWLISKPIDFDANLYDITLQFWSIYVPTQHISMPFPFTINVDNEYLIKTSVDDGSSWNKITDLRESRFKYGVNDYHDIYNDYDQPVSVKIDSVSGHDDVRIGWHYYFDGNGTSDLWVIDDVSISAKVDTHNPRVSFETPEPNMMYLDNTRLNQQFRNTIVIGDIDVEVDADDFETGVEKVDFYVDGRLKKTDNEEPFVWSWNSFSFGRYTLKVISTDFAGNTDTEELTVFKLF